MIRKGIEPYDVEAVAVAALEAAMAVLATERSERRAVIMARRSAMEGAAGGEVPSLMSTQGRLAI